jgi:hypothetical protein
VLITSSSVLTTITLMLTTRIQWSPEQEGQVAPSVTVGLPRQEGPDHANRHSKPAPRRQATHVVHTWCKLRTRGPETMIYVRKRRCAILGLNQCTVNHPEFHAPSGFCEPAGRSVTCSE